MLKFGRAPDLILPRRARVASVPAVREANPRRGAATPAGEQGEPHLGSPLSFASAAFASCT
jgi:hypothetical protein